MYFPAAHRSFYGDGQVAPVGDYLDAERLQRFFHHFDRAAQDRAFAVDRDRHVAE